MISIFCGSSLLFLQQIKFTCGVCVRAASLLVLHANNVQIAFLYISLWVSVILALYLLGIGSIQKFSVSTTPTTLVAGAYPSWHWMKAGYSLDKLPVHNQICFSCCSTYVWIQIGSLRCSAKSRLSPAPASGVSLSPKTWFCGSLAPWPLELQITTGDCTEKQLLVICYLWCFGATIVSFNIWHSLSLLPILSAISLMLKLRLPPPSIVSIWALSRLSFFKAAFWFKIKFVSDYNLNKVSL